MIDGLGQSSSLSASFLPRLRPRPRRLFLLPLTSALSLSFSKDGLDFQGLRIRDLGPLS